MTPGCATIMQKTGTAFWLAAAPTVTVNLIYSNLAYAIVLMTAPARLTTLAKTTLWDGAYLSLKSALLEGRYAPGDRIVLRDVAEELGISLTPVRDAVNRLTAEKILDRGGVGNGGGATVPLLNTHQFRQLMTVRSSLEPLACEAAALHASAAQLDAIEVSLIAMRRFVGDKKKEQYLAEHYRFHFGIYTLCKMPIVLEIIESAWLRCSPTLTLALPEYVPGLKRYEFHVAMLAALKRGDGVQAAASIRADIESARHDISLLLDKAGSN